MPVKDQVITEDYALYNSDNMEVLTQLKDSSIDLSVYSPPFPELYSYSDDPRDMSNSVNYDEALEHYGHVVKEISRLTKPGRLSCVHCCDLKRGIIYQHDFPGDVVRIHEKHGLHYFCRVAIWKDAWEFARRTRMKTLQHRQIVEDACTSRIAPGDHLVVFRKPGENKVPITHEHGFKVYYGGNPIPAHLREYLNYTGDQRKNSLSHWIYRNYASPVWMDIRRGNLMPFDEEREDPEEKHVCPLQLDIIARCIAMWSNPREVVLSPFAGVGSEIFQAVRMGRRGIGCELKGTYYRQACENVPKAYLPEEDELPMCLDTESDQGEMFGNDEIPEWLASGMNKESGWTDDDSSDDDE
jgi:DNA modification methylase